MAPHDTAEGLLLATMPLHAMTAIHGEDGLRARLLVEAGRFPAAQRGRVEAALALMSRLHARDRRQREAYSCHPLRVTIRVLSHYRVGDADVACAAPAGALGYLGGGLVVPGGQAGVLRGGRRIRSSSARACARQLSSAESSSFTHSTKLSTPGGGLPA